jgi:hypothetical protein
MYIGLHVMYPIIHTLKYADDLVLLAKEENVGSYWMTLSKGEDTLI